MILQILVGGDFVDFGVFMILMEQDQPPEEQEEGARLHRSQVSTDWGVVGSCRIPVVSSAVVSTVDRIRFWRI